MNQPLNNFFTIIDTKVSIVKELNAMYGKTLANNFNSLNFWHVGENKISEILAFFLNPSASHGQDDLYLELFIKKFHLDFIYSDFRKIEVRVEKRTDNNRRIDIYINYSDNQKIIGIENKIYDSTQDQKNQVIDYLTFLELTAKEQFYLFYLAPKNKTISKYSIDETNKDKYIEAGNLKLINYEDDIIDLVHDFAIHSENDRVRSFLLDFEKKLIQHYMGENSLNDNKTIINYIQESEKNIELAFKVNNSMKKLKDELKELFLIQLREVANELEITFDKDGQRFHLPNIGTNIVGFSYEMRGIIYGVIRVKSDVNKSKLPEIETLFEEKFQVSEWWAMYRFLYTDIEVQPSFWMDIKNGIAKEKLKIFIKTILNSNVLINRMTATNVVSN